MSQTTPPPPIPAPSQAARASSPWKSILLVVLGLGLGTAASAAWWYEYNFHASIRPVKLTAQETQAMDQKMAVLKGTEPVSDPAKTLVLSERELNGYLQEQGLGDQVKVSMQHGQISATAVLPVDKDVPMIGGHTVRVKISLNTRLDDKHHVALSLADINVGGISLPNAWVGGIKGLDLLNDQQNDDALKGFAAGIKDLQVRDGEVRVVLND